MKTLGLTLMVIGIIMTFFTGFNYITEKKVLDLGSVEITSKEKMPIYWSPVTGGVIALVGALIFFSSKKRAHS